MNFWEHTNFWIEWGSMGKLGSTWSFNIFSILWGEGMDQSNSELVIENHTWNALKIRLAILPGRRLGWAVDLLGMKFGMSSHENPHS